MTKIALATLLTLCPAASGKSQQQPPQLLLRATKCLAAKKFLPSSSAVQLTFGYFLDEKSYPGDKALYIVEYASPTRSNGLVFSVFLGERNGRQEFNIQNNAAFVLSKREPSGVSFLNPPLGGTWTQEHLALAIKEIVKQPKYTIPVKELSSLGRCTSCESYTDPHRKRLGAIVRLRGSHSPARRPALQPRPSAAQNELRCAHWPKAQLKPRIEAPN